MMRRIGLFHGVQDVILVSGCVFWVKKEVQEASFDAPDTGGQGSDVRQPAGLPNCQHEQRLHRDVNTATPGRSNKGGRGGHMTQKTALDSEPVRLLFEMTRENNPCLYDDLLLADGDR